jgi:hypothetical protein
VVLDVSSGLSGAIDIPVSAAEIASAEKPVPPPAPIVTTPFVELPDKVKGAPQPKVVESLTFHSGAGEAGTLSWKGDSVVFEGNLSLDLAASGFSGYAFGGRFHCAESHFVGVDPADGVPELHFTFHNHSGKVVVVDL